MSDQIDLSKKRNRIVLALDIFLGTIFFGECWPTEPMSSYFWRTKKANWIKRVDRFSGAGPFEINGNLRGRSSIPVCRSSARQAPRSLRLRWGVPAQAPRASPLPSSQRCKRRRFRSTSSKSTT